VPTRPLASITSANRLAVQQHVLGSPSTHLGCYQAGMLCRYWVTTQVMMNVLNVLSLCVPAVSTFQSHCRHHSVQYLQQPERVFAEVCRMCWALL